MPPAKRKPIKKEEQKKAKNIPLICFCKNCLNKGDEIRDNIFYCTLGVNSPYGNHSLKNCMLYDEIITTE